jgi:hypothetical protein
MDSLLVGLKIKGSYEYLETVFTVLHISLADVTDGFHEYAYICLQENEDGKCITKFSDKNFRSLIDSGKFEIVHIPQDPSSYCWNDRVKYTYGEDGRVLDGNK